jgi:hypothetical protein
VVPRDLLRYNCNSAQSTIDLSWCGHIDNRNTHINDKYFVESHSLLNFSRNSHDTIRTDDFYWSKLFLWSNILPFQVVKNKFQSSKKQVPTYICFGILFPTRRSAMKTNNINIFQRKWLLDSTNVFSTKQINSRRRCLGWESHLNFKFIGSLNRKIWVAIMQNILINYIWTLETRNANLPNIYREI